MRRLSASLLLAVTLLPMICAADEFDALRTSIRDHMQKNDVPAVAVAVWRDGKTVWAEGFGWADKEHQVPATPDTMFCLASLTKTLTATGLMTLVQAGKIDLDRPANDYLGADQLTMRVGDPKAVTVRSLANHTSGLPAGEQFFYGADVPKLPAMSEVIRRYGIVAAPAGERYRYSNLGYGILGRLLEQVSGRSYPDFMREALFQPLGMTHASVNIAPELRQHQAVRYDLDRKPIPYYVSAQPAAGLVYASASDIARFGQFLLKNRSSERKAILSNASIDRMSSDPIREQGSPALAAGDASGYGVGLFVRNQGGYRTLGHSGAGSGVSSDFAIVPEQNLGVVVLANADGGTSGLRKMLLKGLLPRWQEPAPAPPAKVEPFQPSSQLVGTWQGKIQTYEGEQSIQLKVLAAGDVHVRVGGPPRFGANRSTFQQDALVNDIEFVDGAFTGRSLAQLVTTDSKRVPHTTSLNLKLRGDKLSGTVNAESVYEGFWIYGLPYWTELSKVEL
ncbi:serine hydrolase domain-containing protein [Steroidobacter sp.]|uniref:serine hydrolase domain-containing protein n=1 Tax=Steroidobacter sp. TaxID=1978227 RepID=UPI001A595CD8|nr:serine hydrolase domain-containing protein [Steroidobacter sp.]MBL8267344.1 beta-lactamase family protein [Steroidobacter sp.]